MLPRVLLTVSLIRWATAAPNKIRDLDPWVEPMLEPRPWDMRAFSALHLSWHRNDDLSERDFR